MQQEVNRLTAARDELDAKQVERRRQEDAAFGRYAEARLELEALTTRRDEQLVEIDQARDLVLVQATEAAAAIEQKQRAVLAELNGAGRSAEELSAMFALPVKRVRTQLRTVKAKSPTAATSGDSTSPAQSTSGVTPDGSGVKEPATITKPAPGERGDVAAQPQA